MPEPKIKLALDQNFPVLVLRASELLPEVELAPVHRIDPRLSELDDRKLLIALHQLGWQGLITNNCKMLWVPAEIAAVVKTKLVVFAVEGVGDDPFGQPAPCCSTYLPRSGASDLEMLRSSGFIRGTPSPRTLGSTFSKQRVAETSHLLACTKKSRSRTKS